MAILRTNEIINVFQIGCLNLFACQPNPILLTNFDPSYFVRALASYLLRTRYQDNLKVCGTKIFGLAVFNKTQKFMMFEACAAFVWCLKFQSGMFGLFWTNMASRLIDIDSTSISRHPSQKNPKKYRKRGSHMIDYMYKLLN